MAEELKFQVRKAAKDLPSLFRERAEKLSHPIILAMKGHPCSGRRLVAFLLAATLRCPLVKEDDIGESRIKRYPISFEPMDAVHKGIDHGSFLAVCRLVASQIELGLSVVIDSELCCQFQFNKLKSLANCAETPLIVIECQPRDVSELWQGLESIEDVDFATRWWDKPSSSVGLQRLLVEFNSHSDYDVADIPKFMVDITPAGDIKNCVSFVLQSIATHVESGHQAQTVKCEYHMFVFWEVEEKNQAISCDNCLQYVSGPIYRCSKCNFIFHKSCTELPPTMQLPSDPGFPLELANAEDLTSEAWCNCCNKLIKGYFYQFYSNYVPYVVERFKFQLDLNCIFLPFKRRTKFHEHELELFFVSSDFECDVCGICTNQKVSYTCYQCWFRIDLNCAWLPETAVYERHRHPFKLTLSPRDDDSDQYYCNACEKERNPKHWIYYCADCDFPAHTRCLVPSALPPPASDNK